MVNILGINLSQLQKKELLKKLSYFLNNSSEQHYLVTPNPEIILQAGNDEEFFYILNQADLAPADGFGLKLAAYLTGHCLPRFPGADLTKELLKIAEHNQLKTLILNWENGLSTKSDLENSLIKRFTNLNFKVINISRNKFLAREIIQEIKNFSPILMFVTLGFPDQEKLIYHNLKKLPSVKLALGVGGTFDFLSGKIQRAPKIMRYFGLEWFWRLIQQPTRIKRIYRATVVFMEKFLVNKLINSWRYRPNVVTLLYRNTSQGKKILIVKREDNGQWQLPQGGTDGENIEKAGRRELIEELNITEKNLLTKASFKNLYHYRFQVPSFKKDKDENKKKKGQNTHPDRHQGYRGQKQGLYIAEFQGSDEEIKLNFWDHIAWKWILVEEIIEEIEPIRRLATKIFLEKFKSLKKM